MLLAFRLPGWMFGGASGGSNTPRRRISARDAESKTVEETSTDPEILRIQSGDVAAFERLFRREYEGLVHFATRFVRSADEAEDLVAEVFMSVWNQRSGWAPGRGARAYLYGAVRNRALNARRDTRRRTELEHDVLASEVAGAMPRPEESADVLWERGEPMRALDQLLGSLSPRVKLVLELRWRHGLDFEEIATSLGTTRATAFNLHARAMQALRKIFPKSYREYLK